MDHFSYVGETLHAEDVPLPTIAAAVGSPFYVYASATLRRHFDVFAEGMGDADVVVAFAVKALSNIAVLRLLARKGAGADIVSGGELYRALKAGIPAEKIVFSGVGKTATEMASALDAGIGQFNVEGEAELHLLAKVAREKGTEAPIALRVNPDVDASTDTRISTGRATDKFGVNIERAKALFATAQTLDGVRPRGVAMHIGSQITQLGPFEEAARRAAALVMELRGQGVDIQTLDLGGGLGIPYAGETDLPQPRDYVAALRRVSDPLGVKVIFEPGRMIAGNAGLFVTSVLFEKPQGPKTYLIVDGAMNDLIRPALYGARHQLVQVDRRQGPAKTFDIAGPVCESTDVLLRDAELIEPVAGDLLAFRTAGAYGAVQAGQYNTRPLVPEVLVDGDKFAVIRRRPSYEEMLSLESIPDWL